MAHTFIAYIDECGDDGLANYRAPNRSGGASHWLTLSATVCRFSRDLETVAWRDAIRNRLPDKRRKKPLHFAELNHQQRVMAVESLRERPFRGLCVIANKPVIPAGIYTQKNQLYFYLCRYLIERISWLCRDMRPSVPEGDGRVKIVFSRRGGMSYEHFRAYLGRLQADTERDIQIHWPVIDVDGIEAKDHSRVAGLQLSDIVASGITAGVECDYYGNCELRFAERLKTAIYNRKGNYLSYGMKFYPWADALKLSDQQQALVKIFEK